MIHKFKAFSNPIMFVGDNPSLHGGLSRIGRDLATLTCTMPEFRVGYLAQGIRQNRNLPFICYDYPPNMGDFGQYYIQEAWRDFAGEETGIIMTLDDISRRGWMVNSQGKFFGPNRTFALWMYTPVDSVGPNMTTLPAHATRTMMGFDRVLAASEFGRDVLVASGRKDADWLPHGIFTDKFHIKDTANPRKIRVGCVMANQSRKDFPTVFHTYKSLLNWYGNRFHGWLHTDMMVRYWDVYKLAEDFGLKDYLSVTVTLSDEDLCVLYQSCACTILPSGGEGFGYPIAESMACGTPCVVTSYAAGMELAGPSCRELPTCFRLDGENNSMRAINNVWGFSKNAIEQVERKLADWQGVSTEMSERVSHLDWNKLQHVWKRWLLGGLE